MMNHMPPSKDDVEAEVDRFSKRIIMTLLMMAKVHGGKVVDTTLESDVRDCESIADSIITKTPPSRMMKRR